MNIDTREVRAFLKKMEMSEKKINEFYDYALRQIAADFLDKVIILTPVRKNEPKRNIRGGAMRRAWCDLPLPDTTGLGDMEPYPPPTPQEQADYIKARPVRNNQITVTNTSDYGMYVNYGHKTKNGRKYIDGVHFNEIAQKDMEPEALLDGALKRWLKKL